MPRCQKETLQKDRTSEMEQTVELMYQMADVGGTELRIEQLLKENNIRRNMKEGWGRS